MYSRLFGSNYINIYAIFAHNTDDRENLCLSVVSAVVLAWAWEIRFLGRALAGALRPENLFSIRSPNYCVACVFVSVARVCWTTQRMRVIIRLRHATTSLSRPMVAKQRER